MDSEPSHETREVLNKISGDRLRTNVLKKYEQRALAFLVQRIPSWINSDMLTLIGFIGSLIILISFILAAYINRNYLLLGIAGFAINWFGDSLDGRLAFYRQRIRKWYGFSLDITVDWLSTIVIGTGFVIYAEGIWEAAGIAFVVLYGWAIINTLIKYKITGDHTIDSGLFGPTEGRILISAVLVLEVIIKDSILVTSVVACIVLFIININETRMILHLADARDIAERQVLKKETDFMENAR